MKKYNLLLSALAAASVSSASAAVLVDLNADSTDRNATVGEFEDAIGLTAGTFIGSTLTFINFDDGTNTSSSPIRTGTANSITFTASSSDFDLGGDADGWFGGDPSTNNLLEDGVFMRGTAAAGDPSGSIALSGSGLGLLANTTYDLYLFAGRSQGHQTSFTFDVNDPTNFSAGATVAAGVPAIGGDETLGTVKFTFTTGGTAPSSLAIGWTGVEHVFGSDNNDAVFSGFALNAVPEPSASAALLGLAAFGLLHRRRN